MKRAPGFTLVELLVVIAILAVVAAVLFPVFARAKSEGHRVSCASNFRQVGVATQLYVGDYDDRFAPVNHRPGAPNDAATDRTWVQMILPYVSDFRVFRCPSDRSDLAEVKAEFDQDLVPGDTTARLYAVSMRTNLGYNYLNLAPVFVTSQGWVAEPRSASELELPSRTLVYVDSVWERTDRGEPSGGGSWLVLPPCRYVRSGPARIDTFSASSFAGRDEPGKVFTLTERSGWDVQNEASPFRFGGAWPWHDGRTTVSRADTSVATVRPERLGEGCDVLPEWEGTIFDPTLYWWDRN